MAIISVIESGSKQRCFVGMSHRTVQHVYLAVVLLIGGTVSSQAFADFGIGVSIGFGAEMTPIRSVYTTPTLAVEVAVGEVKVPSTCSMNF